MAFGKWMIFKHWDKLDATWEKVRTAMMDELQGCSNAACTTMRYNPSLRGPGPDLAGMICVYTQEHDMDAIGFKLIEVVEHDIKYKRNQDSMEYKYSFNSHTPVSLKTIYWNNGRPSLECKDRPHKSTSFKREDIWHLNVVEAPESLNLGEEDGRWVIFPEYKKLTGLWHALKKLVESEKDNFGVIRMVCPPKQNWNCPKERPEFHIYTCKGRRRSVGQKLIRMMEDDIVYQYKHENREEVLYWNDGEPDYERVRRKGITKNWRTGKDISFV